MQELSIVEQAFAWRSRPAWPLEAPALFPQEIAVLRWIWGLDWRDLDCHSIEANHDVVFLLPPEAFCFYLPGFICAGIRERRADLLVTTSLIQMLDRSPDSAAWDAFFAERWPLLTRPECNAVEAWIWWLSASGDDGRPDDDSLTRSLGTVDLLRSGGGLS